MSLTQIILPEFDREMELTRKSLERVPDAKLDWKPHPKSFDFRRLATHLAEIPGWAVETMKRDELDLAPPGAPPYKPVVLNSVKEILDLFDKKVAAGHAAIAEADDAAYSKPWSLLMTGKVLMTMPKMAVLRGLVLSHAIHHRAQLGVYLRLNDISVPSIYGPSADEGQM